MMPRTLLPWVFLALLLGFGAAILAPIRGAARRGGGRANDLQMSSAMAAKSPVAAAVERGAVIVGGGPSGLAMALMLAKRGWTDIAVLERSPSPDFFDPLLAFAYGIDGRGQCFFDAHGLTEKLAAVSVGEGTLSLTLIPVEGKRIELPFSARVSNRPVYFVPRSVFQQILYNEVEAKYPDQIKVFYSTTCDSIEQLPEGAGIEVRASRLKSGGGSGGGGGKKGSGHGRGSMVFRPRLLVGADGLKSMVRQRLRSWDAEEVAAARGKPPREGKGRFDVRKKPSASSGLRFKVLNLSPRFRLGNSDDERSRIDKAYVILSKFQDAQRALRIGLMPFGPRESDAENSPRGGNLITLPGHRLWDVKTGEEMKTFLAENFPQVPLAADTNEAELSRLAESEGSRFPDPQYCPGLHWLPKGGGSGGSGAVLIGDAIHAFPPDIGQGANAALEDVLVLERALESCEDRVDSALPEYERSRAADSKALVRLCQIGNPWLYKQPVFLKPKLWIANAALRTLLNKNFPKVFSPPIVRLIQTQYDQPYSKILADYNGTTRRIWGIVVAVALAVVFRRLLHGAARTLAAALFSLMTGGRGAAAA